MCLGGSAHRPGLVERLKRATRPKRPLQLRVILAHVWAMWGKAGAHGWRYVETRSAVPADDGVLVP